MVRRWHLVRCVHACPVCSQAVSGAAQCVTSQFLCYWCIYIFLIYWTRWTLHFLAHPFPVQSSQREREKNITFKHLFEWRLAKLGERESTEGNPWCSALVVDATKIYFALPPPLLLLQICSPCLFLSKWGEAVKSFSCACLIWQQFKTALLASKSQSACQPGEFEKATLHSAHVWESERESERERWGKATRHGSALPTLPYLAEQLFSG